MSLRFKDGSLTGDDGRFDKDMKYLKNGIFLDFLGIIMRLYRQRFDTAKCYRFDSVSIKFSPSHNRKMRLSGTSERILIPYLGYNILLNRQLGGFTPTINLRHRIGMVDSGR
jgi:hypothetical protein